jgi:hypothetical protein
MQGLAHVGRHSTTELHPQPRKLYLLKIHIVICTEETLKLKIASKYSGREMKKKKQD